jgi:superfamily I DNA and RNA helicase
VLRPEFQLVQRFSTQLAMLEDDFDRLTKEQVRVLDWLKETRRLLVRGCAGSGKTVLALEKAIRLARDGKRVLLLCYNIPLAEWLRSRVKHEGLDIVVQHFHGLCQLAAEAAGLPFPVPDKPELLTEFYDLEAPALLEAALKTAALEKFDAIIVDEGQDFMPEWWILIEELLEDPKTGLLYVFYDPDQNIFGRQFGFLMDEAKLTLDRVCRNSRQITGFINGLAGTQHLPADFSIDGPLPEVHEVDSEAAERERVERIIRSLVQGKGVAPERIVVIGKRRRANSSLAGVKVLAGFPLVDEASAQEYTGKIRYATIYRFKGLEADCVVLLGFQKPVEGQVDRLQYCAASRAKSMLLAVYRTPLK